MKILVTGGAGFIGSHIVEHYQGRAEEIRVLDNLRTGYRRNLDGLEHTYIEGSITDRELVKRAVEGVDLVFHMAAMVSVPESMSKPGECVDINVHGLLNVLEEASAAGVRKLVFASSAAVYGDNPVVPKLETMLPEPKSPYAITKLDGEYYLGMFEREGLLETAAIRFFNVFGPRQDPTSPYSGVLSIFCRAALTGQPCRIHGDGEQTRDFIYVTDVVRANLQAAGIPAATCATHPILNIGRGQQTSLNQIIATLRDLLGRPIPVVHDAPRPGDIRHSQADISRARAALRWTPQVTLHDGLAHTLNWFKQQSPEGNRLPSP